MALLVTTRGLGHRGGFLSSRGLGRGVFDTEEEFQGTWDRFRQQQQQRIMQEDEELIIITRAFIEIVSCRH